jgi:hypothetical protein
MPTTAGGRAGLQLLDLAAPCWVVAASPIPIPSAVTSEPAGRPCGFDVVRDRFQRA